MSAGCGCGCNGAPSGCGKGLSMNRGMMLTGSFGVPNPTLKGYGLPEPAVTHRGNMGLGDTCIDYAIDGSCISTVSDTVVQSGGPTESPFPVVFSPSPVTTPGYTPAATPPSQPNPITGFLENLAASWTGTAQQILKAQTPGAIPTYQTVNPQTGQVTTVYGTGAGLPLPSGISSMFGGSGLLLLGGGLLLLMMMGKGGR